MRLLFGKEEQCSSHEKNTGSYETCVFELSEISSYLVELFMFCTNSNITKRISIDSF